MFQIKIRVIVGIMIFFGYFMVFIVRYNISVHIVDMSQIGAPDLASSNVSIEITRTSSNPTRMGRELDLIYWDDIKIGKLFSAYHIGYLICLPIFHSIGDGIGPTWLVGISGFSSGVLSCLTPAAAYYDFWAIFVVRIFCGFCAGAMQPSMVQVLRHWVPPIERNHFMWAYCGITMGTFSTLIMCGVVQTYSRWPLGFYIAGGIQICWSALWVSIVSDHPRKHSFISKEELAYLTNTIGNIFTIQLMNSSAPWKLIIKSVPFWTLCILNFGYTWMIFALCLHGPLFYSRISHYRIYNAAYLTAVPFILRFILGTIAIQGYHWYKHNSKIRRIKHIRKYFIVVSHVLPGLLICSTWLTPVVPGPILLTIAVALTAAGMDMTFDLCYELTPNFVNSVNTVIKIIGHTPGIIVSFCVGAVTQKYNNSPYVWKHIWCFHATLLCVSGVIFLVWGETTVQPWNSTVANVRRPRKLPRILRRPSIMSNIIEQDEDQISYQESSVLSPPPRKSFAAPFRFPLSKV